MSLKILDATVCLALALRLHNSDAGVLKTAKNLSKRLPRSERNLMFTIINHPRPAVYIEQFLKNVPDELLRPAEPSRDNARDGNTQDPVS